ncbi:MAG: dimethylarginine dimethylaminohydrolase family protein [Gemmatimonadaceae bacterium]
MLIALTRCVPPTIGDCELTHLEREPIDQARAVEQHSRYEEALAAAGCIVRPLPPLPDLPDSVFVEDTAVVLPELAITTRPGAESRRPEVESVAYALGPYRQLAFIEPPGTIDGGDVLRVGSTIFVGESGRTNLHGVQQLSQLVSPHGYLVRSLAVSGCLHLKSAVTRVAEDVILINPAWVDATQFAALDRIEVHPDEPFAANALLVGGSVVYSTTFVETARRLERSGVELRLVEIDELAKAEGALTCCSIVFEADAD